MILLRPSDPAYRAVEESYWAPNAALAPKCILQPKNTNDVSNVMKVVSSSGIKFAVRSGGHVQWAGGSSVADGVTIDLGAMRDITFTSDNTVAKVQPGPRWRDVFGAAEKRNLIVTGGRDADVGVGGFLTGGGNAYLTGRNGFGCDTVKNFEVVLADGRIVNANATSNNDLWKALKGGWANFGIVTRFDIEAYPKEPVWGGSRIHDKSQAGAAAKAFVNFVDKSHTASEDAHLLLVTYNSVAPQDLGVITVAIDTKGKVAPPIFNEILAIPATIDATGPTTLLEQAEAGVDPSDDRVHWFTLTFKNDLETVKKAVSVHEKLISDMKTIAGADGFSSQCVLQPIPSYFGEIGARKGGNVMGLDEVKTNSVMWLGTVAYDDASLDKVAYEKLEKSFRDLQSFAKSRGGEVRWKYINYSDKTQKPIQSYGPKNVEFMKQVSKKFDPKQVFQKQMPGSHKLSD